MVAAGLRQAFIQPDRAQASTMLRHVADQLRQKWPKLAAFIDHSEDDVLAYLSFPRAAPNQAAQHQSAGTRFAESLGVPGQRDRNAGD